MPDLAVVVPTLGRPQALAPLVDLFAETTPVGHRIAFVARADDKPTWDAIKDLGSNVIGVECGGTYPAAVNAGIRATDEPLVLVGADDIRPHPGWLEAASAYMSDRVGFVSLNDLGSPDVMAGEFATLPLLARRYIDTLGGSLYCEAYRHVGCDVDASLEARKRGAFAYAHDALMEHMHPDWGKAEADATYKAGGLSSSARRHDRRVLDERWPGAMDDLAERRVTTLSVAVMGHPVRMKFIDELMPQLPPATLVLDEKNDRHETGRRALLAHDREATHHLVVQDDAILCRDFLAGVELVARAARDRPVSLYTGNVRRRQHRVAPAVAQARRDAIPWLEMEGPWWGVAIVLPTADIPQLVKWYDERTDVANYDRRISRWYASQGIKCLYTVPSLVAHRPISENPSLVETRTGDRRAHYFIDGRSPLQIDWLRTPTQTSRRRTLMAQKLILADRRIYGTDARGRRVLVAAPGQPIPPGYVKPEAAAPPEPAPKKPARRAARPRKSAKK